MRKAGNTHCQPPLISLEYLLSYSVCVLEQVKCQHMTGVPNRRMTALTSLFSVLYVLLSKKTPVTHIS